MTRSLALLALPLILSGCAKDTDEDGLTDKDEALYGSDPANADTDGDGISDGDEVYTHGTSPILADSDDDGYDDNVELEAGSDPTDGSSRVYQGGWPYQADKDSFDGPAFTDAPAPAVGVKFPRLQVRDQFGDTFDLYDLAGHGKPVVIDVSAEWCPPCQQLALMLSTGSGNFASYANVKTKVDNGDMYWVTILGQDNAGTPDPATEVLHNWDVKYPNENVPVLATPADFNSKYVLGGWPTVYYLNTDMVIEVQSTDDDPWVALAKASE